MKGAIRMANIKVLGSAMTLTSALKKSEIEKAVKFCYDSTVLKDEDNVPYFIVKTGSPSASKFGVSFNHENETGNAYITMVASEIPTKDEIKETFGEMLFNLNKVEDNIKEELNNLEEKLNTLEGSIEFIG